MIPVTTEENKQLPDIQAPGRAMFIQHNPACALKLNSPQMGFIPFMPSDKGATFLGAWDPSPDSQWESASPVALKHWAAAMTALYPFKIHPSEENEGNTAPGRILFPSCMAVPSPEHWLDIMKVVAVELCVPAWRRSSWKSQDLSPQAQRSLPSPWAHNIQSSSSISPKPLKPSKWMGECSRTPHV